ncbi:hypothetical protein L4X63_20410 [Geomonas sp. Red32]|uniref:hypothetical protein n=1 Tax=Geomonas sp. Red32 TaxID=2912856 RepID=UPI00202CC7C9|nr:hypothetical protein [Geomonas sp. Red32]MCM0083949.1 hypothetical protein [Geomonas sp. Red32]
MSDLYDEQRREGAAMIVSEAHRMADAKGIKLTSSTFDGGLPLKNRDAHILTLATGGKAVEVRFSDEMLADFPGGVGTRPTLDKILIGINELAAVCF